MGEAIQLRPTRSGGLTATKSEQWSENRYGWAEGQRLRNARARALRQEGYVVRCRTWDFTDLARDRVFALEYWKDE